MTTVQLNTRLDSVLKQSGDAVFARYGLSPSEVVRAVWKYAAEHQSVPAFMAKASCDDASERERALAAAEDGAGLAVRLAAEQCGYEPSAKARDSSADWRRVRGQMYDQMLEEMERRCL